MAAKSKRCARCDRRMRKSGEGWACAMSIDEEGLGLVTDVYCPACTTDEEHLQRQINDALTNYVWYGDRVARFPKVSKFKPSALN
jgi:hypothetical protein